MQLDRYASFEGAEFGVVVFAEEEAGVIGGTAVAGVDGVAQAGQKAVLFNNEEGDLSHASGVDDEEEGSPCQDFIGAEAGRFVSLGCEGYGECGGRKAP